MEYRFDHENLDAYKLALEASHACWQRGGHGDPSKRHTVKTSQDMPHRTLIEVQVPSTSRPKDTVVFRVP